MAPDEVKTAGFSGLDYQDKHYKAHPEWLEAFKQMHLRLNVWTINTEENMQWCLSQKFDNITTDEPELLLKICNK
jgi:glycerophosphoryl diester phosphodiesterase